MGIQKKSTKKGILALLAIICYSSLVIIIAVFILGFTGYETVTNFQLGFQSKMAPGFVYDHRFTSKGNSHYYYRFNIGNKEYEGSCYGVPFYRRSLTRVRVNYLPNNAKINCIHEYILPQLLFSLLPLIIAIIVLVAIITNKNYRDYLKYRLFTLATENQDYLYKKQSKKSIKKRKKQ